MCSSIGFCLLAILLGSVVQTHSSQRENHHAEESPLKEIVIRTSNSFMISHPEFNADRVKGGCVKYARNRRDELYAITPPKNKLIRLSLVGGIFDLGNRYESTRCNGSAVMRWDVEKTWRRSCGGRALLVGPCNGLFQGDTWFQFRFKQCGCGFKVLVEFVDDGSKPMRSEIECGVSMRDLLHPYARISHGHNAQPGDFPWHVRMKFDKYQESCGGSILAKRWVLTAAHCIPKESNPQGFVIVGDSDNTRNEVTEQKVNIEKVTVHEQWEASTINKDIAVIKLESDIIFDDFKRPVCLAENGANFPSDILGERCLISGYGTTHEGVSQKGRLQYALLDIISDDRCSATFPAIYRVHFNKTNQVCAQGLHGSPRQSSCSGDSGGPLVCSNDRGSFYQVGVVSWGSSECGVAMPKPTSYADLSVFKSWICEKTDNAADSCGCD